MKRILIRTLPGLVVGVALIVSALIFERGCRRIANGLYNISYSVEESTESIRRNINDFPDYLTVDILGTIYVEADADVSGYLDVDTYQRSSPRIRIEK